LNGDLASGFSGGLSTRGFAVKLPASSAKRSMHAGKSHRLEFAN
jgi:hypothetical protein